jgi:Flp pilus assembly protein TadB
MGRIRDWRWRRRIRRVMRRGRGWTAGLRQSRAVRTPPDPALLRRAEAITDLRERRLAYEEAAQGGSSAGTRGSRRVVILTVACAAVVTFALTVLAAIAGNPWVAATVAALVAVALAVFAVQRPATRSFDHGLRPRRQFRDVREPLDD